MNTKKLFPLLAFVVTVLMSCKKEKVVMNEIADVFANERLLTSYSYTYANYTISYNPDRSIKGFTGSGGAYSKEFVYAPGKVTELIQINGKLVGEIIHLITAGRTVKTTGKYYDANGNPTDTYITNTNYNSEGRLVSEEYFKNGNATGAATYNYDINKNLSKIETKDANGVTTRVSEYEYDLSIPEKAGSFGQFNSQGTGLFYPRNAASLMKKQTITENNSVTVLNYAHTLDAAGYVTKTTMTDNANTVVETINYAWQ